ncbi:MAG: class I tRNA ligase family protein [Candidatus Paceibacterota bacterium]
MKSYDHKKIEEKWQKRWEEKELYKVENKTEGKENYYTLVEFPYPSGNLHTGHWYAFVVPDAFARYKRMKGENVLFPMGFDSFGLPAENAAIKHGIDPREWTYDNIAHMRDQIKRMGNAFDLSREVVTSDPEYYKWTQWLFLKLYEKGLSYRGKAVVNWDPVDKTVLANEQVLPDGTAERSGAKVGKKELKQWFFKITDYADRLVDDLEELDWPEEIKEAQRNWIGRSEGAILHFKIAPSVRNNTEQTQKNAEELPRNSASSPREAATSIEVFTTRPDTLFGTTYMVLSPEHRILEELKEKIENRDEVARYIDQSKEKTEIERTNEAQEKTGVELKGVKAINPGSREEIPIFVADYVIASYGTGAIMAVPAHDERDFAFAQKYNLPVKQVILPCKEDRNNPPQKGLEETEREVVVAFLKNNATGKYALLNWHGTLEGITTGIMGGIDDGETPEEAVLKEIQEEAAINNARVVRKNPWISSARYCASHKGVNRTSFAHWYICEVDSLSEQGEIPEEEAKLHTLIWVDEEEVLDALGPEDQKNMWSNFLRLSSILDSGKLIQSGEFDGLDSEDAKEAITKKVGGEMTSTYRIRDWLLSRQRYWGCPIPIVYDPEGNPHPVSEEHLPWLLPEDVKLGELTGKSPLATSKELHERVEHLFGVGWTPEYDTMDTFVDSSWYFLRYLDPYNETEFSSKEVQKAWMPVARYSGGAEHTTMHVLYSRFFQKALFDLGLVTESEPYRERLNRGLILGTDGRKMSKRWGNVVDPDEHVERVGADCVRTYLAFIGPYNEVGAYPWDMGGIAGVRRFLEKVNTLSEKVSDKEASEEITQLLHESIMKVGRDIESFKFNTSVSQLMVLSNRFAKEEEVPKEAFKTFLKLLAPFAPHLAEELWLSLRERGSTQNERGWTRNDSVHMQAWPEYDEALLKKPTAEIAIQVNGKLRGVLLLPLETSEEEVRAEAEKLPAVEKYLTEGEVSKVVFVPGKLINFVVKKA